MNNYFFDEQDEPRMGHVILAAIAAVVVLIALVVGGKFAGWWFSNATANTRGNVSVHNQVNGNGSYRIAAYDHFFDLCASVQTDEASITAEKVELSTTTDAQRKAELSTNITALVIKRSEDINKYNADARKSATEGQFRDSNLPYQLDPTQEATSCTS